MKFEARDISFSYGKHEVLSGIRFDISEGQILGILGPNGGGKSTLLKLILGLLPLKNGGFYLDGVKLERSNRPHFSYVSQEEKINPIFPLRLGDILDFFQRKPDLDLKTRNELLERFELSDKINHFYQELSGGQKKRLQIVSALLSEPKLLILDEPTSGLDGQGQDQLLDLVHSYSKEKNTAVLVVDHNINEIIRHSDKILCLNKFHHWHDRKDFLTKDILKSIYHCEFEHLMLHHEGHQHLSHKHVHCQHDHKGEHHHD